MPLWNSVSLVGIVLLGILCLTMIIWIARRSYAFFRANANPTISTFWYLKDLMTQLDLKPWSTFVDLWCGNWSTLRRFATEHPELQYTWVDINRLALWRWKIWIHQQWLSNIKLQYQDIYTVDLNNYDYVYCFLMPSEMKRIQDHFDTHLPTTTTVIVASFKMPDRKPIKTIPDDKWTDKIFIYRKMENNE